MRNFKLNIVKRFIAIVMVLLIATPYSPVKAASKYDDFTIINGTLVNYTGNGGEIAIPDDVIEIGYDAFRDSKVTKITMNDNVEYIGNYAFHNCENLKSIKLSNNLKEIGAYAFINCKSLVKIDIPNTIEMLDNGTFEFCSNLSKINIPASVERIDDSCFTATKWLKNKKKKNTMVIVNGILIDASGCQGKVKITIPANVKHINEGTFCISSLKEVIIPESVISIGDYAFSDCNNLEKIDINKSVKQFGIECFSHTKWLEKQQKKNPYVSVNGILVDGKICKGKIKIPKSVKRINDFAFSYSNIENVTIPENVTNIGQYAFVGCKKLNKVTISKSVKSIGRGCFENTRWINNQKKKNPLVIINSILIDGSKCKGNISIPDSVNYINDSAFENCDALKTITMNNNVVGIGDLAFRSCDKLTEVKLSENITHMGSEVFMWCIALNKIKIPLHLSEIPKSAFAYCENLMKIELPQNDMSFGNNIFYYCNNDLKIYGYAHSNAEEYAKKHSITFENISTESID